MKKRSAYINFIDILAFLSGALIVLAITWVFYSKVINKTKNIPTIQAPPNAEYLKPLPTFEDYEKAAEQGSTDAQYTLGLIHYKDQNYTEAAEQYRKAAEKGNAKAQYSLGNRYYEGKGVKQSYEEAFKWYKKAAEQGHAQAQFNLGCMYGRGEGVKKNHFEAIQWISKAAEQGNTDALELMKNLSKTQ